MKFTKNNVLLVAVFVCSGICLALFFSHISIFFLILSIGLSIYAISVVFHKEDRNALTIIFVLAFLVRFIAFILSHSVNVALGNYCFSGDESLYWQKITYISQYGIQNINWSGRDWAPNSAFGLNSFVWVVSFLACFLENENILVFMRLFNVFIGSISVLILYLLAKEVFNKKVGLIAASVFVFWPSIIIWSINGLKEPLLILSILFVLLSAIKNGNKISLFYTISIFLFLLNIFFLNKSLAVVLLVIICFIFFVSLGISSRKKHLILLLSIALLGVFSLKNFEKFTFLLKEKLHYTIARQTAQETSDSASYHLYDRRDSIHEVKDQWIVFPKHLPSDAKSYNIYETDHQTYINSLSINWMGFIFSYFKGLFYTFFSPFLWDINSPLQLMVYPQMVIIYFLWPFNILGVFTALRINLTSVFPILLFLIIMISMYAITEGNVGGLFRHRDWLIPFFLMFSSVGILRIFWRKSFVR